MKDFLLHQDSWKASQLKGKSQEEIERLYYTAYKKVQQFVTIEEEDDARRSSKRHNTIEEQPTEKDEAQEEEVEEMSHDHINNMLVIMPESLHVDPLQAKHPIMD